MTQDYQTFLQTKRHTSINFGIEPDYIPDSLFDFQKHSAMGRKGLGIELKDSYFKQAVLNIQEAEKRFIKVEQLSLIP